MVAAVTAPMPATARRREILVMAFLPGYEAAPGSALDTTHGQAAGHFSSKCIVDHHRRDGVENCRCHQVVPRCLVAVEELAKADWHRQLALRREQQERVKVFIPR